MALITAKDYLDSQNNSPSTPSDPSGGGLISAKDFKARRTNNNEALMSADANEQYQVAHQFDNLPLPPIAQDQSVEVQQPDPSWADLHPVLNVVSKPFKFVDRLSKAGVAFITPDAPYFDGKGGYLPGPTPKQEAEQRLAGQTTGSNVADKIADFAGQGAALFVNPAAVESGIIQGGYNATKGLALTKAGQKAEDWIGKAGAGVANKINPLLNTQGINVGSDLAGSAAQNAARGAVAGGVYGAVAPFVGGTGQLQDVPLSIAENAAMFGAGDAFAGAAIPALGAAVKASPVGRAFEKFISRDKPAADPLEAYLNKNIPDTPPPVEALPDVVPNTFNPNDFQPVRLRVQSDPNQLVSKIVGDIKPIVTERMTPPLENENELAKWVLRNLNDPSISLNEVRQLPYEDLRVMAEEIRKNVSTYDTAVQVAKERGHDLPALFEGKVPNVFDRVNLDAQKRVAGIYPDQLPPISRISEKLQPMSDEAYPFITPPELINGLERGPRNPMDGLPPAAKLTGERQLTPADITPNSLDAVNINPEPRIRDRVVSYFDEVEQAAKDRLAANKGRLNSLPVDQLYDYAVILASKLVKGTVKFSDWSAEMIKEFGEGIKPHLKEIAVLARKQIKEAERRAEGVAHLPGVNQGVDPLAGNKDDIASLTTALEHSPEWKDKNRFLLNRETTERNFEDVMGKDAGIMKKTYIEPIQKAAADRQRWISKERSDIKDLGIKYKSPEDALVQEYGEGIITLEQLQDRSPDNWQKVKHAAETMRSKYDQYLGKANEVLLRNGYPEIPKRKDYFPHYEEIDGLLSKLGFGFEDNTLPAELNGLTANLKPGKNFFNHFLQRKGDETTLGALAGHDRYVEGISKVIHQTDNIRRLRGLDKTLRQKSEASTHLSDFLGNLTDYINILAGKKTEMDRSLEAGIGRNLYSAVDMIKRRVGGNMIGGSISSALTNSIPVTQLLAETGKDSVLKGMTSALKNIKGNDEISAASNFLTRRFAPEKLAMGKLDKAQKVAGSLFKFMDHFTSNMVIRSKYYEGLKTGMTPDEALHSADQYATKMMGDRSEGSMPTLFHSRTFGLITQFQLEVNNQLSHLFKDMPKTMSKAKYASAITQVFVYDYLYNQLYEKVTGNRPAFDPIGVAVHAIEDFSNDNPKAKANLVKNASNNLPFASTLTGGRIPVGAALPNLLNVYEGKAKITDELLKPAKYLALPFGGSQINKTVTGLSSVGLNPFAGDKPGAYTTDSKGNQILKYPIEQNAANVARGMLFGPHALPETDKFTRNGSSPLSADQTKRVQRSPDPKQAYARMMKERELNKIETQMDDINKDPKMSRQEKLSKVRMLQEKLKKAK